jgi:ankyrin repeat protein
LSSLAMYGHKGMIERLIVLLPDVMKIKFAEALSTACNYGHLEVVKSLLKAGADPNVGATVAEIRTKQIYGGKPLVVALNAQKYEVVDLLLKSGADPSSSEASSGATPLLAAVLKQDILMVNKLLSVGANVNALCTETEGYDPVDNRPITYQRSLLSFAVQYGMVDICKLLIEKKIKVSDSNQFRFLLHGDSNSILNEIHAPNDQRKCITLLLEEGYDPNLKIDNRVSLIAYFYADRNIKMAKLFVEKGAKIEDVEPYIIKSYGRMISPPSSNNKTPPVKKLGKLNLTQKAAVNVEPEFLTLFLKAGGKLDTKEQSSAYFLSKDWMTSTNTVDTLELACVKIFVEQGIAPEEQWRNSGYQFASAEIKAYLNERFPAEKPKAEEKPKEEPSR